MQESFWWWQCTDRYIISLFPHLHTPFPSFSPSLINLTVPVDVKHHVYLLTTYCMRVHELCESRGGRPGLSVLMNLTVSVDVKQHWTVLRHWSQFVPNMSTDIREHEALLHHYYCMFTLSRRCFVSEFIITGPVSVILKRLDLKCCEIHICSPAPYHTHTHRHKGLHTPTTEGNNRNGNLGQAKLAQTRVCLRKNEQFVRNIDHYSFSTVALSFIVTLSMTIQGYFRTEKYKMTSRRGGWRCRREKLETKAKNNDKEQVTGPGDILVLRMSFLR